MALKNGKRNQGKPKNRANKINLVFDEAKRREFLTGFRKRKLLRKKQAQEKLEKELNEERKRLKHEAKESYKKLLLSHRDILEIENLHSNEYEEDDVTVQVVELSANDIAKEKNWIGANHPKYKSGEDNESEREIETEEIPGMDLKVKPDVIEKHNIKKFESEKQLKKQLKKRATKNVQKSKIFQKKNKVEQLKQKKQSAKITRQKEMGKHKGGKKKGSKKRN